MAQTASWLSTASPERRSEFMSLDSPTHSSSVAPRPIPQSSDLNRWDLAEILNPPAAVPFATRDRKMSIDFAAGPNQPQHGLYGQPDLDSSFNLHGSDNVSPSPTHQLNPPHAFDHPEPLEPPEHPHYDLFPNNPASGPSFSSQRYRTNASSSSSLGPNYGVSSEGIYSHASFGDSLPSFNNSNGNPYDMINSLSSSYSSGKGSPLTPNDPVGGLHHPSAFPGSNKDYSSQNYPDMPDRRMSNVSSPNYQNEFSEEYAISPINGMPFQLQHFQERLGRFQPGDRFNHSGPPTTVPSHIPPGHSVAPHATHSFREGGMSGYDDMPHYMNSGHQDMSLRMPTVDETLARMKLQGHSIMGSSNDLQTFIRYAHVFEKSRFLLLIQSPGHILTNMFALPTA